MPSDSGSSVASPLDMELFDAASHIVQLEPAAMRMVGVVQYVEFWHSCCVGITEKQSRQAVYDERCQRLSDHAILGVQAAADRGSAAAMLDLGVRLYIGCSVVQNADAARVIWRRVANLDPNTPGSSRYRARAFACLSFADMQDRCATSVENIRLELLWKACEFADASVKLGYTSSAALVAARAVTEAGLRLPTSMTATLGAGPLRALQTLFSRFTVLWVASDAWTARKQRQEHKSIEKETKQPNAYICAAEGCGIGATSKSTLKRCSGPCESEQKPAYCSKDCQRLDWARHKHVCKGCQKGDSVKSGNLAEEVSSEDVLSGGSLAVRKGGEDDSEETMRKADDKEYYLTMPDPKNPGKVIRISSTALTPATLRAMREFEMNRILMLTPNIDKM